MIESGKRLTRSEQQGLFDLLAAASLTFGVLEEKMRVRLEALPETRVRLEKAKTALTDSISDILRTATAEQKRHLRRQLDGVRHRVWVGKTMFQQREDEEFRSLDINEMNTVANAIAHVCADCPYDDPQSQRSCEYRKLMDCLAVDPDKSGSMCGWFTFLGTHE